MADSDLTIFCRQVRQRSIENKKAISLLHHNALTGSVMGVLRQELDSMVRVIYLLAVSDRTYRAQLIRDSVNGKQWRKADGKGKVTDRDMVDLSARLHGWAHSVYAFGCGFIHLSAFHDYAERDPFDSLTPEARRDVGYYLSHYHFVRMDDSTKLSDIEHLLPAVFNKISTNLEYYVEELEAGRDLEA